MEIDPIAGNLIDDRHFELLQTLHEYSRTVAPQLDTAKSAQVLNALDRELSNLRAALDAGLASDIRRRHGSIVQLLSIDLLVTLEKYLSLRGLWQEKLHWGRSFI
ncbi:MAG: hypothetical protein GX573_14790 [Chloroflexi bacterium]|nr:hypothetical protein [Chloroflexota bacterium]